MIKFEHVFFKYPQSKEYILKDLNLEITKNDFIAIIGKSGSGKTTIMKLLTNQIFAYSGNIEVMDFILPLTGTAKTKYLNNISVVLQKGALFRDMTVYENIAFAISNQNSSKIKSLVYEQMKELQLDKAIADYYPYQLSGGMVQKVAIARANIIKKPLVIYDEPCAGLDPESSRHITELMYAQHLQYSQTVLLITHNIDLAYQFADKVMKLEKGTIISVHENNNK